MCKTSDFLLPYNIYYMLIPSFSAPRNKHYTLHRVCLFIWFLECVFLFFFYSKTMCTQRQYMRKCFILWCSWLCYRSWKRCIKHTFQCMRAVKSVRILVFFFVVVALLVLSHSEKNMLFSHFAIMIAVDYFFFILVANDIGSNDDVIRYYQMCMLSTILQVWNWKIMLFFASAFLRRHKVHVDHIALNF